MSISRARGQLLVVNLAGMEVLAALADGVTLAVFAVVTVMSIVLNVRDWRPRQKFPE